MTATSLERVPAFTRPAPAPRFGMLSTFPPTACGIATFSAALCAALEGRRAEVGVIDVGDGDPDFHRDQRVVGALMPGSPRSRARVVEVLDTYDVALVQHEYGIYGGADGAEVLDVLGALATPSVVVAHTVLLDPTPNQRLVLEEVARLASRVVVMTESARDRLTNRFAVDPDKVALIPHGAGLGSPARPAPSSPSRSPLIVTWGLLGPGKGIEWMLEALSMLTPRVDAPRYLIAGRTHPKVASVDGERYRDMLVRLTRDLGLEDRVSFDPTYRDLAGLAELTAQADLVVLPYDSVDQVTSGVLVDAVAAGCPVIATSFPHATELLRTGAGLVVPRRNPEALAAAVRRALEEPGLLASMAREARRLAPMLGWGAVAERYEAEATLLLDRQEAVAR